MIRDIVSIMDMKYPFNTHQYGRGDVSPTLYQTYLWAKACDATTLFPKHLRRGLKAWMTLSSTPQLQASETRQMKARRNLPHLGTTQCRQRKERRIFGILAQAETCFASFSEDEQDQIKQFELQQRLIALHRDILTEEEVIIALHDFAELGYRDAQSEIERLLTSGNPELRSQALEVLVFCWRLLQHKETVWKFLRDGAPQCRYEAIISLAALYEETPNQKILATLARVVMNPREHNSIRRHAYKTFLKLSGYGTHNGGIQVIEGLLRKKGAFDAKRQDHPP